MPTLAPGHSLQRYGGRRYGDLLDNEGGETILNVLPVRGTSFCQTCGQQ